jgi:hypothetical protein
MWSKSSGTLDLAGSVWYWTAYFYNGDGLVGRKGRHTFEKVAAICRALSKFPNSSQALPGSREAVFGPGPDTANTSQEA